MRYLYLHGFQSGAKSVKAEETRRYLAQHASDSEWLCPQLSPYPAEAIKQLHAVCQQTPPDILIGSSLGGFYATHLAEHYQLPAVLINPAITPERELRHFIGPLHNAYSGEDYVLGAEHMTQLADIRPAGLTPALYWLVLGTADEVLDWREAARHYAGARQTVLNGDDHRLQGWPQQLPALLAFANGIKSKR